MNFESIVYNDSNADRVQFWKGSNIWLNNPHLVNRRVLASTKIWTAKVECDDHVAITEWIEKLEAASKLFEQSPNDESQANSVHALEIVERYGKLCNDFDPIDLHDKGTYVCLKKLLPRNSEKFSPCLELTVIDKGTDRMTFLSKHLIADKQSLVPSWPYRIEYSGNRVLISVVKTENNENDRSIKWLKEQLFPRLLKWMENDDPGHGLMTGSLTLVSAEKYATLYNNLKKKYGTEMVKIWPENTDPAKFVYEDIAIATYLLLLWEKERQVKGSDKKQSFLDLGCGNGLLVHILASEGHQGLGLDLRKRKIWDIFPENTRLEVRTIVPSDSNLFPETDWLIGNHSDELTPWIPVIAARSSYHCRFFLLPCCAYEFDGRKYQRDSASKSQYFEYMRYVKNICEMCGFKTDMDKLRIPSTKRVCLIGSERTYSIEDNDSRDKIIQEVITARSAKHEAFGGKCVENESSRWSLGFKPRDSVERVRNCTQLDKGLISDIVNIVTAHLLSKVRLISMKHRTDEKWNAGGQIELTDVVKIIPGEMLKQLKSECGGLQTLLKNNSNIFQVVQGKVQFRVPGAEQPNRNRKKNNSVTARKVKPCWFHENHPNGCPVLDEACSFKH